MAIFKGDEPKFAINLTAPGFSMDTDDFDVEVVSTVGGSLKGYKNPPAGSGTDVIIFSETDRSGETPVTTWYVIVNTANELKPGGKLKVIATAYVPDAHADDGIRKQTATAILDNFTEP